jgi:GxxExxY protein
MMETARDVLTERIIGAAIEVHRVLGPGLLEAAYETCLAHELAGIGLRFARQVSLPIRYKDIVVSNAYRIDLVVEDEVVLEVKAVEMLTPVHMAQLMTYLRLGKLRKGLLLNFNARIMKDGIKRIVI